MAIDASQNGGQNGAAREEEKRKRREHIVEVLRGLTLASPKRFVSHTGIHPDEFEAIRELREELPNQFPGIDIMAVPVILMPNNNAPFEGKSGWEHLEEGTYIIGCGGSGPFNHHPPEDFPDICSADQVAIALGIDDRPELRKHLRRIRVNDLNTGGELTMMAEYLRDLNVQTQEEFEQAFAWIMEYLGPFLTRQAKMFAEEMKKEFDRTVRVWGFTRGSETIPVATINGSDNEDIVRFTRLRTKADIIIKRETSGNVQIFTNPFQNGGKKNYRKRVTLKAVGAMLRHMDQRAMGMQDINEDWDDLTQNGFVFSWYNMNNQTLLNGSITARDVNPTHVPLARIEEAVVYGNRFREFPWKEWLERVGRKDLSLPMFE